MTRLVTRDRSGQPFIGSPAELKRHNNALRQREHRARKGRSIELPVSDGLNDALVANMSRGGFTDPRELLALTQLNLAKLPDDVFALVTAVPRHDVTDVVDKYAALLPEDE